MKLFHFQKMSYYDILKTKNSLFVYFMRLFLKFKFIKMSPEDKKEIIRDNRVARLLWFTLGFFAALLITWHLK